MVHMEFLALKLLSIGLKTESTGTITCVVNNIVKQLVDEGISTVDWETSLGEWEYIKAPYSGCDVLIVAGADRDATRAAVQLLIDGL